MPTDLLADQPRDLLAGASPTPPPVATPRDLLANPPRDLLANKLPAPAGEVVPLPAQRAQSLVPEHATVDVSGGTVGPDFSRALSPKYPTGQTAGGFIEGFAEPVPAMTAEQTQANALEQRADAIRQGAARQLSGWFDRRQHLVEGLQARDPGALHELNARNAEDPFPSENLRLVHPENAQRWARDYDEMFRAPAMAAAGRVTPGWHVGANLAERTGAALAGLGPTVAQAKVEGVKALRQIGFEGPTITRWQDAANQGLEDAQALAEHARHEQQFVAQQLPQTAGAELATGMADLGVKTGAATLAGALTKNPRVGAAVFNGLFAGDAAGTAYQEARNAGRDDETAQQDAVFSGMKAALIAKLPVAWPALAKEVVAVRMAGAYLSGTAITTADASANEAWLRFVRGEKPDGNGLARIGMAFLEGGPTVAAMHGAHAIPEAVRQGAGERPATGQRTSDQLQARPTDLLAEAGNEPNTETVKATAPDQFTKPVEKPPSVDTTEQATKGDANASTVRADQGPVRQAGDVGGGRQDQGGQDLQRETPQQPGGAAERREVPAAGPPTEKADLGAATGAAHAPVEKTPEKTPENITDSITGVASPEGKPDQTVNQPPHPDQQPQGGTGDDQAKGGAVSGGAHEERLPEAPPPPKTGKLDDLEAWARGRIAELDRQREAGLAQLGPEQRRQRGGSDVLDPQRLALYGVIGAAKIGKGVKAFADWSAEIIKDVPELAAAGADQLRRVWRQARRISSLDDDTRSDYVASAFTQPAERTLTTVRRITGQVDSAKASQELDALGTRLHGEQRAAAAAYREGAKVGKAEALAPKPETTLQRVKRITGQVDTSQGVSEADALAGSMKAQQRAAAAGYKQAAVDVTGLKSELARIVRENLPPGQQRQFLDDVARVNTPGEVALAIAKGRRMLADHDVGQALSSLEDLVGTLKINVVRPNRQTGLPVPHATEKTERVLGDVSPTSVRTVDLRKLPMEERAEVGSLLEDARYLKDRLRKASAVQPASPGPGGTKVEELGKAQEASIEAKQKAVEKFNEIDRKVRQVVANYLATKELRIGDRLVEREKVAREVVDKIAAPQPRGPRTSEPGAGPPRENLKKLFGRQALSMDAIASNMTGPDSDAYRLTIENVRRAQSNFHGEQRRTHEAFEKSLDEAGIPAGSKKLHDWLSKREGVTLPDGGAVSMTRDEMLDVVATAKDPQTRKLLDAGLGWTFKTREREEPIKFSRDDLDALEKQLTPGELKLIDTFRDRNKQLTGPAIAAKLDLSGSAPTPHEGYYPRSRNRKQSGEAGLPEGWRGYLDRAMENVSSMEARAQDARLPLQIKGFIPRVFDHFDDTAKLIHLAEPVRGASALWEHPDVTRAIAAKYGESMNRRIQGFLRDTMMVQSAPPVEGIAKWWQAVAHNVSRAWLQLNPSPMGKNVFGGTISLLPEFELQDFAAGLKGMFSGDVYQRMTDGSGVAWTRYHGGLYGAYTPMAGGEAKTIGDMSFWQASKAALAAAVRRRGGEAWSMAGQAADAIPFMEYADSVPLRAAWAAAEHFVDRTKPDLKGAERTAAVADKFERALYRTQNGSSSTEVSGFASSARGNPFLAAWLMFKSDSAKKYSLLAMMRNADAPTRAKTLAAVALNSLLSAGVVYGLRRGATALGRAAGGKEDDPQELERARQGAVWNAAKDVTGIVPLAGTLADIVRATLGRGEGDVIGNPVEQTVTGVASGLIDLGREIHSWAQSEDGTRAADKAYAGVQSALMRATDAAREAAGDPTVPITNYLRRAWRAARYDKPDPRVEAAQAQEKQTADVRASVPASARALLAERAKLEKIREALSPAERDRLAKLDLFERSYGDQVKDLEAAAKAGDQAGANRARRAMQDAARGVDELRPDPRVEAVREREAGERKLHESMPREVRDAMAEHARLGRIPKEQRTPQEREQLERSGGLNDFAQFYNEQLRRIRYAQQKGNADVEQQARQRLAEAAKRVKGG